MDGSARRRAVGHRQIELKLRQPARACEHYSGCKEPATHIVGYWYPSEGAELRCETHRRPLEQDDVEEAL